MTGNKYSFKNMILRKDILTVKKYLEKRGYSTIWFENVKILEAVYGGNSFEIHFSSKNRAIEIKTIFKSGYKVGKCWDE